MQLQPIIQNTMFTMQATTYLIHKSLFHDLRLELKPEFPTCAVRTQVIKKEKKRWSTFVSIIFQTELEYFCYYCFFKQRWSTFVCIVSSNRGELLLFLLFFQLEMSTFVSIVYFFYVGVLCFHCFFKKR
jgi:hypothetical protein